MAGHIVFVEFPNNFLVAIEFDDLVAVAEGDEEMAVRQKEDLMHIAGDSDGAQHHSCGIEFEQLFFALGRDEWWPSLVFRTPRN